MTNPVDSNITMPSTSEETTILGEGKREIPADIIATVSNLVMTWGSDPEKDDLGLSISFEEALLAERERCLSELTRKAKDVGFLSIEEIETSIRGEA